MSLYDENEQEETEFDLSGLSEEDRDMLISIVRSQLGDIEIWTNENDEEVVRIPISTAELIKAKVSRSLKRSDLSTQILRLGTEGFVEFLFTMLRPFVENNQSRTKKSDSEKDDNVDVDSRLS